MKWFISGGRCSGKTAFIKTKLKSGYVVFSDDNYARLCYSDTDIPIFTIIDDAYKDISPNKYKHLVKLGKHLKLGKQIRKQIRKQIKKQTKKRGMQYLKRIKIKKNK